MENNKSLRSTYNKASKIATGALIAGIVSGTVMLGSMIADNNKNNFDLTETLSSELSHFKTSELWQEYESSMVSQYYEFYRNGETSLNEFVANCDYISSDKNFENWLRRVDNDEIKSAVRNFDERVDIKEKNDIIKKISIASGIGLMASIFTRMKAIEVKNNLSLELEKEEDQMEN